MGIVARARAVLDAIRQPPWLLRGIEITLFAVVIALCAWGAHDVWHTAGPKLADANLALFGLALLTIAAYYLVFIFGWIRILGAWGIARALPGRAPGGDGLDAREVHPGRRLDARGPCRRARPADRRDRRRRSCSRRSWSRPCSSAISGVLVFVISLAWVRGVDAPLAPLDPLRRSCARRSSTRGSSGRWRRAAEAVRRRRARAAAVHDDGARCSATTA